VDGPDPLNCVFKDGCRDPPIKNTCVDWTFGQLDEKDGNISIYCYCTADSNNNIQ
jgi:hypothetical protein